MKFLISLQVYSSGPTWHRSDQTHVFLVIIGLLIIYDLVILILNVTLSFDAPSSYQIFWLLAGLSFIFFLRLWIHIHLAVY